MAGLRPLAQDPEQIASCLFNIQRHHSLKIMLRLGLLVVTLLGRVHLAHARRLSPKVTEPEVDFSFMGKVGNYTGRSNFALNKFSEWLWADRHLGKTREEITAGHKCQKVGERQETYYAASFCYWVPEIFDNPWGKASLSWKGGPYPSGGMFVGDEVHFNGGHCVTGLLLRNLN